MDDLLNPDAGKYLPYISSCQRLLAFFHVGIAAAVGKGDHPLPVYRDDSLKRIVHDTGYLIPFLPLIHRNRSQCQGFRDGLVHRLPAGTYHDGRDIALLCKLYRRISPYNDLVSVLLCPQDSGLEHYLIVFRIAAYPQARVYLVHLLCPIDHVKGAHHRNPLYIPLIQARLNRGQHIIASGFKFHTRNFPPFQGMGRESPGNDYIPIYMLQLIIVIILHHLVLDVL